MPQPVISQESFINIHGWFPRGKEEAFFPLFSPISSWNNPVEVELDTYQIYAVGHIFRSPSCDDKKAYHIPHLFLLDPRFTADTSAGKLLNIPSLDLRSDIT